MKKDVHVLCFEVDNLSEKLHFSLSAMKVQRILSSVNNEIDGLDILQFNDHLEEADESLFEGSVLDLSQESTQHQAFGHDFYASFFDGKTLLLGKSVVFRVLEAKNDIGISPYLSGWAKKLGIEGIYLDGDDVYMLVDPPEEIGEGKQFDY